MHRPSLAVSFRIVYPWILYRDTHRIAASSLILSPSGQWFFRGSLCVQTENCVLASYFVANANIYSFTLCQVAASVRAFQFSKPRGGKSGWLQDLMCHHHISNQTVNCDGTACSIVVKVLDLHLQGRWFDPWCGHDKICTAVGLLRKALNPTLLQGVYLLLSLINCKSPWIKASAKRHVMTAAGIKKNISGFSALLILSIVKASSVHSTSNANLHLKSLPSRFAGHTGENKMHALKLSVAMWVSCTTKGIFMQQYIFQHSC